MQFKFPNFGKSLKMKYNFNPILQNQFVLYLFLFMVLVQIVIFVNNNDTTGIILMCLIGFLTSFFSKNMIVILCLALVGTSLLQKFLNKSSYEGFEEKKDKKDKKKDENKEETEDVEEEVEEEEKEDDAANSNEKSDKTKDEMKKQFEELKKQYPEFKAIQDDLINGILKIDPVLEKAEAFMNKYSQYKIQKK